MKKIEIDTFLQFQFVSNPLFSPDGANAAFLVTVRTGNRIPITGIFMFTAWKQKSFYGSPTAGM